MRKTIPNEIFLVVQDTVGFHTRTAAMFARTAACFSSSIRVFHLEKQDVNGKSMLGLMSLGVKNNGVIRVTAEGDDAHKALAALKELVDNNFLPQP